MQKLLDENRKSVPVFIRSTQMMNMYERAVFNQTIPV